MIICVQRITIFDQCPAYLKMHVQNLQKYNCHQGLKPTLKHEKHMTRLRHMQTDKLYVYTNSIDLCKDPISKIQYMLVHEFL